MRARYEIYFDPTSHSINAVRIYDHGGDRAADGPASWQPPVFPATAKVCDPEPPERDEFGYK